jgi:hypothetical protein
MSDNTDMGSVTEQIMADASRELALDSTEYPQAVRDAGSDAKQAIGDVLAVVRKTEAEFIDLGRKADLVPVAGLRRLRRELVTSAKELAAEADGRAARALDSLHEALVDAAQPQLDPSREALTRDELRVALGSARGDGAALKALNLAQGPNRELVACLASSYGWTLLESRGVSGVLLAETKATLRKAAAATAAENATTPREIMAGQAIKRVGKLAACRGGASAYLEQVLQRVAR